MKIHKPYYYDNFICIADRCSFTCCRDWKIGVDDVTKAKWANMPVPNEACDRNGFKSDSRLKQLVKADWNVDSIKLCDNGLCPLLNEKGLCDVVLTYGEENISNTCHTFPREEHEFDSFTEKTLACGCPAVLDLLWSGSEFEYKSEKEDTLNAGFLEDETDEYVLLRAFRDKILEMIDNTRSIETTFKMLFYIALDCFENDSINLDLFVPDFIGQLEKQISEIASDLDDSYNEQNELWLDMAENYRNKKIYSDIIEPLAEAALKYEDDDSDRLVEDRLEFEKIVSKQRFVSDVSNHLPQSLDFMLRQFVREEVYSTMLLPGGDLYSMVMKLQWLAITYAIIRHCLFLKWKISNELTYEDIRLIVAVIVRMTGYSEEDIEEYLENSFEEIIWEWGYMALIMGE